MIMEALIETISKLELKKKDILVLKVDIEHMTKERSERYMIRVEQLARRALEESEMENKILILPSKVDISVIGIEEQKE